MIGSSSVKPRLLKGILEKEEEVNNHFTLGHNRIQGPWEYLAPDPRCSVVCRWFYLGLGLFLKLGATDSPAQNSFNQARSDQIAWAVFGLDHRLSIICQSYFYVLESSARETCHYFWTQNICIVLWLISWASLEAVAYNLTGLLCIITHILVLKSPFIMYSNW